jgi:hypothetical protein
VSGRRGVRRFTHLFALSAVAIAQPQFAKLGPAPGYFAAHGLTSLEVVLLALALVLIPPAVLIALEWIIGLVSRRARWVLHLVFVAGLVALIALPPLGGLTSWLAVGLSGLIGVGFALAYARFRPVRSFATVLGFAPLLFLVVFLFVSSTSKMVMGGQLDAWKADDSYRPPVVFIQFDALPSLLLQTPNHQVDAKRFPNFARLAHDGVWYRNASPIDENTVFSVPSFVDGQLARKGTHPWVQDHNPNLFTELGPIYRMNVTEEAGSLCPYQYCARPPASPGIRTMAHDTRAVFNQIFRPESARKDLPSISGSWRYFTSHPRAPVFKTRLKSAAHIIRHLSVGRVGRFEHWLANVGHGGSMPELDYIHMFLPHEPRAFLPDGKSYPSPDPSLGGPPAYNNLYLSEQELQRDILQLGFTDKVVGEVIRRLKALGIYDDAMIVVVADHGESFLPPKSTPAPAFVPGHLGYRRAVTTRNLADIASIPMFIKYPKGHGPSDKIDDRFVRAVDVFPTILHTIGLPLPPVAGRNLTEPRYHGHTKVAVATTFDGIVQMGVPRWQRRRELSLRRRVRLFGYGSQSVYAFGPNKRLVGRRISDLTVVPGTAQATVDNPAGFKDVDAGSPVCQCLVAGRISGANPVGMPLAIALNGRIVATPVGFGTRGATKVNWSAMIPPGALAQGPNQLVVYRIKGQTLERLGSAP